MSKKKQIPPVEKVEVLLDWVVNPSNVIQNYGLLSDTGKKEGEEIVYRRQLIQSHGQFNTDIKKRLSRKGGD